MIGGHALASPAMEEARMAMVHAFDLKYKSGRRDEHGHGEAPGGGLRRDSLSIRMSSPGPPWKRPAPPEPGRRRVAGK